jgi:hypothetical protein
VAARATAPPLWRARLAAQLLTGPPAPDPLTVVERLLAVQAQEARGARLAIRARTAGGGASDVDRALTDERSLLLSWLNRGTLHLVRREDHGWLHALTTPQLLTGTLRRLRQEGVGEDEGDRGVDAIGRALAADGPLTRAQLRDRLDAAGVRTAGQAMVHLLALATLRGLVVRGPVVGRDHAYVLMRDWIGQPAPVDRAAALAELARRYLRGHGPADDRDLARWAGITLADARAGLRAIGRETVERADGLVALAGVEEEAGLPPPRLLGPYEPLLLGWRSRAGLVLAEDGVVTSNGIIRPVALVGGQVRAVWSLAAGKVAIRPLEPLTGGQSRALEREAGDVLRYLAA